MKRYNRPAIADDRPVPTPRAASGTPPHSFRPTSAICPDPDRFDPDQGEGPQTLKCPGLRAQHGAAAP